MINAERAYVFLHDNKLFESTGEVSKRKLEAVVDALRDLGDVSAEFQVNSLLLPGATRILN